MEKFAALAGRRDPGQPTLPHYPQSDPNPTGMHIGTE
jgi:hypothetical protein